ncbi:MAG: CoA transferase, partial [Chloroflexi bacterium]|nr:CoA transferase [Chloroflexota bacterium]
MAGRNRNNRHQSPMPLEDLLVLDLCSYTSGSTAAVMMADFGAEVVKVEQPPLGDGNRNQPPFVIGKNGQKMGASFFRQGRNKQSIALDLYVPEGQRILKEMAKSADVLIENFKPGTMEKMGLGYETLHELNPRLIYASISGFGHRDCYDDSYRLRGMFDPVAQALSGVM